MRVMVSNVTRPLVLEWAERYGEDYLGNLFSPDGWRTPRLPYALDNGRFPASQPGRWWDMGAYVSMMKEAATLDRKPMWALVPDVVGDREKTLLWWEDWAVQLAKYGHTLAFAAQDGMTPRDVPPEAEVVFVGGSTEWKWGNLHLWTDNFPRVHVGRVNHWRGLWRCHDAGVESCDGTGWFRGDQDQLAALTRYLETKAGLRPRHKQLEIQ